MNHDPSPQTAKRTLFLLAYCLLLYLLFLWQVPLLDPDEPVYGETAKEMIGTGDFLSPRIYGDFWYDKPPLFYWMEAASFSLFGVSTLTARLPSALLGAASVLYLYRAARPLLGESAAFLGAFIFASSLETVVLARSAVTDMALTASLTVAMMAFLRRQYALAYIACGFALLAKGPVGFGFPALIVGLWLLFQKKFTWKPILSLRWYWGIPLACLVGCPWYIYMTLQHGSPFIDTFLGYHNLARFAQPEHAGKDHWWLYIVVLAAGCFPWSGAAAGMLGRLGAWRRDPVRLYLIVWAAFIFLFFSLSSTQLFSYIFPMYPPLSLLSALYILELRKGGGRAWFLFWHGFFLLITMAALCLAPLMPMGGTAVKYGFPAVLLLLGAVSLLSFYRGRFRAFCLAQGASALLLTGGVWFLFAPAVTEDFTSAHISAKAAASEKDPVLPLYIDPFYRPAAAFYHDLYGKALPLRQIQSIEGPAYLLVQKRIYEDWPPEDRASLTTLWETKTALFLEKKG